MSDANRHTAKLRERLTTGTEDKLGKALADLFENPLVTGTIGRAFDARERAAQAQELALAALNIPTAADIERLTRRLRSVSQRLEGIEDGVHRINRALTEGSVERRLLGLEDQLKALSDKLVARTAPAAGNASGTPKAPTAKKASTGKTASTRRATATRKTAAARKTATARETAAVRKTAATRKTAAARKTAGAGTPKRASTRAPRGGKSA